MTAATLSKKKPILGLMTHVVAGYPDEETTVDLVRTMEDAGASCVEIQIPFSDPLADGPVIMGACAAALERGMTVDKTFRICRELAERVKIPLYLMSYVNIPHVWGAVKFTERAAEAGLKGVIIPDLPFDEEEPGFFEACRRRKLSRIQVVSPGMAEQRLDKVLSQGEDFIYSTLKVGITGTGKTVSPEGLAFLDTLAGSTNLPVAAGFGLSSPEQMDILKGKADYAVVGSRTIEILQEEGVAGVGRFVSACVRSGGI